jgi:hypothetical protein
MPVASASGAAVCAVRCSVVTKIAASSSDASRSATARACASPASASGGSPRPSTSGNRVPGTAAAEAPWRTSTISVAPSGSRNGRCG